jgi:hypothetical protein
VEKARGKKRGNRYYLKSSKNDDEREEREINTIQYDGFLRELDFSTFMILTSVGIIKVGSSRDTLWSK